ncbi:glycosyltransferase family 4 protein [Nitrospira sp. Nam74]
MKLILVIGHMKAGGAERVMSIIANYWAAQGRHVTLITIRATSEDFYQLHPLVKRIGFGLRERHILQNLSRLRREIRRTRPDAVISFMPTENVLSILACVGLRTRNIICEHTDPRQAAPDILPLRALRYLLYRRAYAVVVLSERIRSWAETLAPKERVHVIPNPVALSLYQRFPPQRKRAGNTIAAIGRLNDTKGFDILISAFSQVAYEHLDWSLVIIGEGPERSKLEAMAGALTLQDRVHFPGCIQDTIGFLRTVDLFIMSSHYEGFPMTLIEAMACGLPVISTRWDGAAEIIRDEIDGVLVTLNDPSALATAMNRLISDPSERKRLGEHAVEVSKRFNTDSIMNVWETLINPDERRTSYDHNIKAHGTQRRADHTTG